MRSCLWLSCFLLAINCGAQSLPKLDSIANAYLKNFKTPALAMSIIKKGEIHHLNAYGLQDVEEEKEATIHSAFHIASVSKTVTNLAIFKLVEEGKIDLAADINSYLPFKVQHPAHPTWTVTVKKLLNHRSGIRDNYVFYKPFWSEPQGDPTLSLSAYLKDYLTTDGEYYDEANYSSLEDIEQFSYCNTAYALLGLIVEEVAEQAFEDFCQEHIFKPLDMTHSSWYLRNLAEEEVVKSYVLKEEGKYRFRGHNGYPDYPAGQLRTSIADFTILIQAYLNVEEKPFILKAETLKQITPNPGIAHNGFYTWFLTAFDSQMYYNHQGGDVGVRTIALMDLQNKNAIILFVNGEVRLSKLWRDIAAASF